MNNKIKLITIDYDEYIELSQIKNNLEMCVLVKLKSELSAFRNIFLNNREISTFEVRHTFDKAIDRIDKEIANLDKKPKLNELEGNNE